MGIRIGDPESWRELWSDALKDSKGKINRADAQEKIDRWDKRSKQFATNTGTEDQRMKQNQILNWLKDNNGLKAGFKVLDIGAGTGRFAIAMAEMDCEVVAVEPAKGMVDHMEAQIKEKGLNNIQVIHDSWQNIDLKAKNFEKVFDLVFASMTPGIQTPEDMDKMIEASKNACYLSTHTKSRWTHLEYVMREIIQKPISNFPNDFLYRFGYVYSLGHMPITNCFHGRKAKEQKNFEKQKEDLLWMLSSHIDSNELTDDVRNKVDTYIENITPQNNKGDDHKMSSHAMLWFI